MTLEDATSLAFTVHGATWIATVAAYYRYGDRTDLFDKSLRGCRRTRQSIRDALATSLSAHLGPVVKDSARVRSAVLDAAGHFLDQQANLAESEPYYQAIRDFVSRSAGALVDYRLALDTVKLWKTWAHRLSKSILFLLVLETVMLGWTVIAVVSADLSTQASRWTLAVGSAPTTAIILARIIRKGSDFGSQDGVIVSRTKDRTLPLSSAGHVGRKIGRMARCERPAGQLRRGRSREAR